MAFGLAGSIIGLATQTIGLVTGRIRLLARAPVAVVLLGIAAIGQVAVMERALITRDFTVAFVAQHGSHRTPAIFNVATLWSALEGSILLWVLVLVG